MIQDSVNSLRPLRLQTTQADFEARLQERLHWSSVQDEAIHARVKGILERVRLEGDAAVLSLTKELDGLCAKSMSDLEICSRVACRGVMWRATARA